MDLTNIPPARASYKLSGWFRGSEEFLISSLSFCWQRFEIDDGISTMRQVHWMRAKTRRQEQKRYPGPTCHRILAQHSRSSTQPRFRMLDRGYHRLGTVLSSSLELSSPMLRVSNISCILANIYPTDA